MEGSQVIQLCIRFYLDFLSLNGIEIQFQNQPIYQIIGISMHKGYAFVQFTSPFDARSACLGEDGRSISGQVIDVNMVSEPKPNHGQQKTNASSSGNKGMGQKRSHGDTAIGEGGDDIGLVNEFCYIMI